MTVKNKIERLASVFIAQEWIDVYADNNSYTTDMFKLKDSDGKLYGCKYEQYHSIYALEANADGTYNGTLVEGQDSLEKIPDKYKVCGKSTKVYGYSTTAPTFKVKAK